MPGFRDRAGQIAATRARRPAAPGDDGNAVFRREGDYFTVAYRGELARVRDLKGLRYLAALLGAPGREVHVLELVAAAEGHRADDRAGVATDDLGASRADRADPVLDAAAKHAYRRRLRALAEELEQARSWNDPEREAGIRLEIDALTTELERALGLGGGDRSLPSSSERARISVTKAIGVAIRAVSRDCPKLGEHLAASVRTGRLCSYAPPAQQAPTWRL
jgi:non-specific serine/threonine protein kinase